MSWSPNCLVVVRAISTEFLLNTRPRRMLSSQSSIHINWPSISMNNTQWSPDTVITTWLLGFVLPHHWSCHFPIPKLPAAWSHLKPTHQRLEDRSALSMPSKAQDVLILGAFLTIETTQLRIIEFITVNFGLDSLRQGLLPHNFSATFASG